MAELFSDETSNMLGNERIAFRSDRLPLEDADRAVFNNIESLNSYLFDEGLYDAKQLKILSKNDKVFAARNHLGYGDV